MKLVQLAMAKQILPCVLLAFIVGAGEGLLALDHPIVFVTQTPEARDFTTIGSTFGNHRSELAAAPRGGDLWIRYPDGRLKNLTKAAGYGEEGFQGAASIAVRDPEPHWDGEKVIFSMVIGAPSRRYEWNEYYWQLYEISGLGPDETPVITRVPNQPEDFNNVSPIYTSDDQIIFTTDRPRNGQRHLYPQLDEYEEAPTVSGLWKLDPANGDLSLLDHAPSGVFTPRIDRYGRVIFTRWDHLQRDQQADADARGELIYGTFNYADESPSAAMLFNIRDEVFPEPRRTRDDLLAGTNLNGHNINFFLPWMVNQDGTELETLNHVGRHELHRYFNRVFNDDDRLDEFIFDPSARRNPNPILNMFHIREDPLRPGVYFGVDAPEFQTHSGGMIFTLDGAPETNADQMRVTYITPPASGEVTDGIEAEHPGFFRDPLPTVEGTLLAVHSADSRADRNDGTRSLPQSRYEFRIRTLRAEGDYWVAGEAMTEGIIEELRWWDPDEEVIYNGPLWELSPVELRARPRPEAASSSLEEPERLAFQEADVELARLREFLAGENLALVVSRNVTTRDDADQQQPYHLKIAGEGGVATMPENEGAPYEISHLQFFQGDQIRGIGLYEPTGEPRRGRRVLAQTLHDEAALRFTPEEAFDGSVRLGSDGSMAAVVPAQRALSWQLLSPEGEAIVRERYWLTFQPGEVRTCANCHGQNEVDQVGGGKPTNTPRALVELLGLLKPAMTSGEVQDGLRLRIHDLGSDGLELRWNESVGNVILESTTDLSQGNWLAVEIAGTVDGSDRVVRVPKGGVAQYFRLR